jgi:hypothetical protein
MRYFISLCAYMLGLCLLLMMSTPSAWGWSGELTGELNDIYVNGAGSVDPLEGISLLGTLRHNTDERAVFQLKIPSTLINEQRVEFEGIDDDESLVSLEYQIYASNGRLVYSAFAESGWLIFSPYGTDEMRFNLSVRLVDRNEVIELSTENLRLVNPFPSPEGIDHNEQIEVGTGVRDTDVNDQYDPFEDAVYEDEGCDFSDESDSRYESEGVSCESNDSDDDLASDDGCTDDEWAAEASVPYGISTHRHYLKRWRAINRLLPFICSILLITIWRRILRRYKRE